MATLLEVSSSAPTTSRIAGTATAIGIGGAITASATVGGGEGYHHNNIAWDNPGKLIPMARHMLDKKAAFPDESIQADIELKSVSPGQIADLCHIQHSTNSCGPNIPYTPLNPYRMSTMSEKEPIEASRLDARMVSLMGELEKLR